MAQPDNGIPIKGWYHDQNDRELEKMIPFLRNLVIKKVKDVRQEIRKYKEHITNVQYGRHHHISNATNSNHLNH